LVGNIIAYNYYYPSAFYLFVCRYRRRLILWHYKLFVLLELQLWFKYNIDRARARDEDSILPATMVSFSSKFVGLLKWNNHQYYYSQLFLYEKECVCVWKVWQVNKQQCMCMFRPIIQMRSRNLESTEIHISYSYV